MEKTALFILICYLSQVTKGVEFCREKNEDKLEEGRECKKSCTREEDCKAPNKSCFCDSECGSSCFNKESTCGEPGEIENGRTITTHKLWGGVTHYTCRDGFVLKGRETRKCNADKRWGGNPPTCETGCSRPDDVANSYLTEVGDTFLVGEDYKFSCNSGYYMVGEPSRICISVEEGWSDAQYHCRPKLCDVLEDVQNSEIHYSKGYEFGSTATVQCHEGYRISSTRQSKKCYPGDDDSVYGDWRGVLPTCEIVTCPVPAAPDHGSIRDIDHVVLEYRQEIIYQCDEGYRISGPERGTCSAEGNWGNVPNCAVDPDCDFSDNSSPTCGYTSTRWNRVPTTNHFGLSGYAVRSGSGYSYLRSMSLPHHSVCLSFYYRFSTSSILKVEEVNYDNIYWATHENEISSTWISAAVTINPSSKFRFEFHADRYGVLLDEVTVVPKECENNCGPNPCQNGGTCYNRIGDFTCFCTREFTGRYCRIDRRCPDPPRSIPHGERTYISRAPLLPSSNAQYTCDTNHKFDGDGGIITRKTITCAASGSSGRSNWDSNPSELRCRAIECPPLSPGDNSRLLNPQAEWVVNDRAEFECENGWIGWDTQTRREMRMEIRCQSNGVWSGVPPNCIRPYCTYKSSANKANSPLPVNLQAKYPVGSKVYFKCKVGFELTGSGFSECIGMETWRGAIPTCSAITCPPPPRIDHVYQQLHNRESYGFIWSVYCRQHYFLNGPRNMTCQWDRTWSAAPKCSVVNAHCQPEMSTPANGTKEVTEDLSRTNFFCDDMFELRGRKSVFCGPGGRWYGATPKCEEVASTAYSNVDGLQYLAFMRDDMKGNYTEAQNSCRKLNGNLATIFSETLRSNIARSLLASLGEYSLIYIGLKKRPNTRDTFDWDTKDIPTTLPDDWRTGSRDRHWDFSRDTYYGYNECVTLRRRGGYWNKEHAYRKTNCEQRKAFLCQRNIFTCRPNPCQNGGTCVRDTCACLDGYTGNRCQTEILCDISTLDGGYRSLTRSLYSVGEKIPLICDAGYGSRDNVAGEAECLLNGEWRTNKFCGEITCRPPTLTGNAQNRNRRSSYKVGSTIYIGCGRRYEIIGDTVMQCKLDGRWTDQNAECREVKCGPPHLPPGAFIARSKYSYDVDDEIEISCRGGYIRTGRKYLQCQEDKTWRPSEDSVECRKTEVATTTITTSMTNPTTTRMRTTTTTPAPTSTSGAEPCRDPKLPDLSYISDDVNDFPSGTTITLRCLGGRSVRGDPDMTCNNGEWTESNVKCVAITCSLDPYLLLYEGFDIEGMDYDDIQGTDFPVGQELTLVCFESETPTHDEDPKLPPRIVCQEGGRWSPGYRDFTCTNA